MLREWISRGIVDWIAWAVLCVQMPIPLFWLAVHPFINFWRRRPWLVYSLVGPAVWILVDGLLLFFHEPLFDSRNAPPWAITAGMFLVVADALFIVRIHRELGHARLFGHAELAEARELMHTGLYARVRHPRYTGMMAAVLGACLMAGTLLLWVTAIGWGLLALLAVSIEERELHLRFGQAYRDYAGRVPRFLPFRFWPREDQ